MTSALDIISVCWSSRVLWLALPPHYHVPCPRQGFRQLFWSRRASTNSSFMNIFVFHSRSFSFLLVLLLLISGWWCTLLPYGHCGYSFHLLSSPDSKSEPGYRRSRWLWIHGRFYETCCLQGLQVSWNLSDWWLYAHALKSPPMTTGDFAVNFSVSLSSVLSNCSMGQQFITAITKPSSVGHKRQYGHNLDSTAITPRCAL